MLSGHICRVVFAILTLSIFSSGTQADIRIAFSEYVDSPPKACDANMYADQFLGFNDSEKSRLINGCILRLQITGSISEGDSASYKALLDYIVINNSHGRHSLVYLDLNSRGGNIAEAIMMAKYSREIYFKNRVVINAAMGVFDKSECSSACVIVLASALKRSVSARHSRVGIHRPFFVGEEYKDLGYASLADAYGRLEMDLKGLLKIFHIPESLVDHMYSVPSKDVHYLSAQELSDYRLNQDDLVFSERSIAIQRKVCGGGGVSQLRVIIGMRGSDAVVILSASRM